MKVSEPKDIPKHLLKEFNAYLHKNLGLFYPDNAWKQVEKKIPQIAQSFGFRDPTRWLKWLMSRPVSNSRVATIAQHLTIGETYFFRDIDSLKYIKENILTPLIHERQYTTKHLKIWSCACCTGEEPYTLSLIIDKRLPRASGWDVSIIGTDINPEFITKAKVGTYRPWSLRSTAIAIKKEYFTFTNGYYHLCPAIRNSVKFAYLNLVEDKYPSLMNGTTGNDLILCNNVLIYLSKPQIQKVVNQLVDCLVDGGCLCVSPVEAPYILHPQLKPASVHLTNIFRKTSSNNPMHDAVNAPQKSTTTCHFDRVANTTLASERDDLEETLKAAQFAFNSGDYKTVLRILDPTIKALHSLTKFSKSELEALKLAVRASANLGELDTSLEYCRLGLSIEKVDPHLHYLQAVLCQEIDHTEEAVQAIKRALFLDADFTIAYFALGNILMKANDFIGAKKQYQNALATMQRRMPEELLPEGEGLTVERMRNLIENMLERL